MQYIIWIQHIKNSLKKEEDIQSLRVSTNNYKSYTTNYTNGNIGVDYEKGRIKLPKLKKVKIKIHRNLQDK